MMTEESAGPPVLEPLELPLSGVRLIEASAGTGKTYTIGTLYLRLLLESGLGVDELLVVTFTRAATEELRERIRRRVRQALAWVESRAEPGARGVDDELGRLLEAQADPGRAGRVLSDALARMDEVAVYTIHGLCQRLLQDHALETGAPFDVSLVGDEQALRQEAVRDFWRRQVATMERDEAAWLVGQWASPETLLEVVESTLGHEIRLVPEVDRAAVLAAREEAARCLGRMRGLWGRERDGVVALLRESPALNRRSYTRKVVDRAIAAMDVLMAGEGVPVSLPRELERFTPDGLAEKTRAQAPPPEHPFFELCGELAAAGARLETLSRAWVLSEVRLRVREAVARRKAEQRVLGYDDLLGRVDLALRGAGGEDLAAAVRARFPAAMIDEFQDTDPIQYRIFRRIYAGRPEVALFLIGDPKQAIYAFRGADIFTYMRARRDAEAHYTLGVNWRSASGLVRAVNALFGRAQAPFVYAPEIAFHPVRPGPDADAEPLRIAGQVPPPLELIVLPMSDQNRTKKGAAIRVDRAREMASAVCAERIVGLLTQADAGAARIGERPLRSRDIAVLVRTHAEGGQMQAALRERGVASVTISQESVFDSEEAAELATVLEALADPADERGVRAALATRLLGATAEGLYELSRDEEAWEAVLARIQDYRELWLTRGPFVALQRLLHDEDVPGRLLARMDGERRLTNLLQLAELLHGASRAHPGMDALLRWLADQRAGGERDEARQLRLESDEGLVQIVTMHKSKGLEYPVVFIPFPWSGQAGLRKGRPFVYHDPGDGGATLDLGSEMRAEHEALAATEALAERLRLLYVALTRARHQCLLCWGRVNGLEDSSLAYLLHRDAQGRWPDPLDEGTVRADLEALAQAAAGDIWISEPAPASEVRWGGGRIAPEALRARPFRGEIASDWRVISYSALALGSELARPDRDALSLAGPRTTAPRLEVDPAFRIPRGARAGSFFHELLEHLDFPVAGGAALEALVGRYLDRYGLERGWLPAVTELVGAVLDTALDLETGLRLRDVPASERLNELEFHYPLAPFTVEGLEGVLSRFEGYASTTRGLTFDPARGLMRGFIDLVFRHAGRYYVVDYKSNHLGDHQADYAAAQLAAPMAAHRYDLQYLVYVVALHRYLGRRLSGYDYARHFGGVYYLFLRGMRPASGPRHGVYYARPEPGLIRALDALFGAG